MPVVWSAVFASILPNIGGLAGSVITKQNIPNWYEKLNRPSWRPPNWLFAPVWTALYTGMGYASYLVWRDGNGFDGPARLPLTLYASQLALNWAWTPIFFGKHKLGLATAEIVLLAANILACIVTFKDVNETASLLMVPYLAWVSFASLLTYRVWRDNPNSGKAVTGKKD